MTSLAPENAGLDASLPLSKTKRNVSESLKKIVAADQKWTCAICQHLLPSTFEVDHIKALYLGGTNDRDNLQALCASVMSMAFPAMHHHVTDAPHCVAVAGANCHRRKTVEEELQHRERIIAEKRLEVFRSQLNLYFETIIPDETGIVSTGTPFPLVKHVMNEFCNWPLVDVESRLADLGHVPRTDVVAVYPSLVWRPTWVAAGAPEPHPERCIPVRTLRLRPSATAVFKAERDARRARAEQASASALRAAHNARRPPRAPIRGKLPRGAGINSPEPVVSENSGGASEGSASAARAALVFESFRFAGKTSST